MFLFFFCQSDKINSHITVFHVRIGRIRLNCDSQKPKMRRMFHHLLLFVLCFCNWEVCFETLRFRSLRAHSSDIARSFLLVLAVE